MWCRTRGHSARGLGSPSSPAGVFEWIESEGRGGGCWLLHVDAVGMIPCGDRRPERGASGAASPTQRGALCCLAEPTGLWFLT